MQRGNEISRAGLIGGFAVVLALASPLRAQTITPGPGGTVSVQASDVSLSRLLETLAQVRPFDRLNLDPAIASIPVTVDVRNVSMRQALISVLDAAGVDYVLTGSADGAGFRVSAMRTEGGRHLGAGASKGRAIAEAADVHGARLRQDRRPVNERDTESRDAPSDNATVQYFQSVVTAVPIARTPGTVVQLPFPDRNGVPLSAVVPSQPVHNPLPGLPLGRAPAAGPTLLPADPAMRDLYEALLSRPKTGGK
jgi:hypothetical protein